MSADVRTLVHDLRTPLTLVEGFAELLVRRGDELTPAERAEHLERIVAAAREMRTLLDAARAEEPPSGPPG